MLRQFEKISRRLAGLKLDLMYFNKCEELSLIPQFLTCKLSSHEAYRNSKVFFKKALGEQKKLVAGKLKDCKIEYKRQAANLRQKISICQFRLLVSSLRLNATTKIIAEKTKRHNSKLYRLWMKQRPATPDCVINCSSKQLTLSQRNALMYGLNHSILPSKIDPIAIRASVDGQVNKICQRHNVKLSFDNENTIRQATERFINVGESVCNSRKNRFMHRALRTLSRDTTIRVCKMDKGVGTVIMDSEDYYKKLDCIVGDQTRFVELDYNINTENLAECSKAPWITKERRVANYLRQYIKPLVDDSTYWRMYPKGTQPGKLYGTAKHHKEGCPMRPVLSAVNTPEYHLAKWMEKQLKPFVDNRYSVPSSSTFVDQLSQLKPTASDTCVSFDIKSLYTNVPLDEVIDDIAATVYSDTAVSPYFRESKITKTVFKNILRTCSRSIFVYNKKLYMQKDGVAMGSPLAPLLADWFVTRIENKILSDSKVLCRPTFYRRYVDDIFAVFKSMEERDEFFNVLNNMHKNLKFTMETTSPVLPFLDVGVSVDFDAFHTQVYRKPTNTHVIMNYHSEAPLKWKQALIRCLLQRAHRLSSCAELFFTEVETIKTIFAKNAYPPDLVDKSVNDYFNLHSISETTFQRSTSAQQTGSQLQVSQDLKQAFLTIPYLGKCSIQFQRQISNQMKEHQITTKAAYNTVKVSSYFSLKSTCSSLFKSNVIYRFRCSGDQSTSYIGESQRQLFKRILEHTTKATSTSAVFEHLIGCNHCQSDGKISKRFEILRQCDWHNVLTFEALLIRKHRPTLNVQLGPSRGMMTSLSLYH